MYCESFLVSVSVGRFAEAFSSDIGSIFRFRQDRESL